jgi:uncharacterized protein (DUF111 family)
VVAQGFGAGTRELEELPNCTQVVLGTRTGPAGVGVGGRDDPDGDADAGQPVAVLEVTVDDATGEQLAHAVASLLESGAHDAWLTPVIMKKGRPGFVVHALCDPARVSGIRAVLRSTTGSFGVRRTSAERWPSSRSIDSVVVDGQLIRVKVGAGRVKAEHDDVAAAARRTGRPLRELALLAEASWLEAHGATGDGPEHGTETLHPLARVEDDGDADEDDPA